MTTHDTLIALAAAIGASFGYQIARHRYQRRAKWNGAARYIKCRDCGLEHAVYANGETHALRETPKRRPPGTPAHGKGDSLEFDG